MSKVIKAGCILLDIKNKKIALVYRDKQDDYSFPKGHVEDDETLIECALRETAEETKRDCKLLIDEPIFTEEYVTSSGENVIMYYFLSKDIGPSSNDSKDTHTTLWIPFDLVYNKLTYPSLRIVWNNVKDIVNQYLNN